MIDHLNKKISELKIQAAVDNLDEVQAFVEGKLEEALCPMKTLMQISVAVEEIFVNIAQYAYEGATGDACVTLELSEDPAAVTLRFADRGVPYDPLAKPDPDTHLPAELRDVGGLGVYMTKQLMDELSYEYKDGQNVLTMKKRF